MSSYRPNYSSSSYNPPPSRQEMPPLPRGPPPGNGMYQFGMDSWRPRNENIHQANEFSFQTNNSAPQYPQPSDPYPQIHNTNDRIPTGPRHMRENGNRWDNRLRQTRGGGQRVATADRPLLKFERGSTPEQMLGMINDLSAENRFLNTEDLSDSGEEVMDESDVDKHELDSGVAVPTANNLSIVAADNMDASYPYTSSKEPLNGESKSKDVDLPIPRWSNPECYTALPPPDESQRKKKDVVKLIRKARVTVQKDSNIHNQVAKNDDFISFNFGDDPGPKDDGDYSGSKGGFSHLQNFNSREMNRLPGIGGTYMASQNTLPQPQSSASTLSQANSTLEIMGGNGKRKRVQEDYSEDEILIPRPPKRKKGFGRPNGTLVQEWVPLKSQNPVPWVVRPINLEGQASFRLHKEICDFYEFVKPQTYEQVIREDLLLRLRIAIQKHDPTCELQCFGSFAAGLYLPNADMDLVMISQQFRRTGTPRVCQDYQEMKNLGLHLSKNGIADPGSIDIVAHAKVPIIKFVDMATSLRVDLSFENDTGLIANDTFNAWKKAFPAMPVIVMIIKQFLMMRELNEVVTGGLGGFSITCLVTSLLQNMPQVQTGELKPEQHLGEMLLEFLDLYGNQLDISRAGISLEPPGYFDKQRKFRYGRLCRPDRLAIIDPNKTDNDISGGSKNVVLIFDRFSRAREEILSAMHDSIPRSMLGWMLGGNYDNFLWQRQRLRKLYRAHYGYIDGARPQSDRDLVDLSLEDMSMKQHTTDDLSNIHSGLDTFIFRSQCALPGAEFSNTILPARVKFRQALTGGDTLAVDSGLSKVGRIRQILDTKGIPWDIYYELLRKIKSTKGECNSLRKQDSENPGTIDTQREQLEAKLASLQSDLLKPKTPKTAQTIEAPPTLNQKGRNEEGRDTIKEAEATLAMKTVICNEQNRSRTFKLNYPKIAAAIAIPDRLTKGKRRRLLAQYNERMSTQGLSTTESIYTQNLSSGDRALEGAYALMALRTSGDQMDNPISIN